MWYINKQHETSLCIEIHWWCDVFVSHCLYSSGSLSQNFDSGILYVRHQQDSTRTIIQKFTRLPVWCACGLLWYLNKHLKTSGPQSQHLQWSVNDIGKKCQHCNLWYSNQVVVTAVYGTIWSNCFIFNIGGWYNCNTTSTL